MTSHTGQPTLHVFTAPRYKPEKEYILAILLTGFLGLQYRINYEERADCEIRCDNKRIVMPDVLFRHADSDWLKAGSMPSLPLPLWDTRHSAVNPVLTHPEIPIIYGLTSPPEAFQIRENRTNHSVFLPIDIFGSSFFMLTRYEERVLSERDAHNRFPSSASIACQADFIDRPIVNEYVEILWWAIAVLWPGSVRRKRAFRVCPTHDVDVPFLGSTFPSIFFWKHIAHRAFKGTGRPSLTRYVSGALRSTHDPFDTFDWIMDVSEAANLASAFYFKAGGDSAYDRPYRLDHPRVAALLSKIGSRQHEIGFHPSYRAGQRPVVWRAELANLQRHMEDVEIRGGRHHYLLFDVPHTWQLWNSAGLAYDSTLGFPDRAGFRCGTCYAYPVFDLVRRCRLSLHERPLILMENSELTNGCETVSSVAEKSLDRMLHYKAQCRRYNGDFVFLWHNSQLADPATRDIYQALING